MTKPKTSSRFRTPATPQTSSALGSTKCFGESEFVSSLRAGREAGAVTDQLARRSRWAKFPVVIAIHRWLQELSYRNLPVTIGGSAPRCGA